jgi:16S rRNA (guanine966-N2)-methyltransferase
MVSLAIARKAIVRPVSARLVQAVRPAKSRRAGLSSPRARVVRALKARLAGLKKMVRIAVAQVGPAARVVRGAEEVRIVGGDLRGRPLATPKTQSIRPTTDRTREAVFNVLMHRFPDAVKGKRVLDLFAGTGALGLEAISRGASAAVFIEESAEGRGLIRENVEAFGLSGRTKIFRRDATGLGPIGTLQPFSLVFADPPYGKQLGEAALSSALAGGWLEPDALCMVEESADAPFKLPQGFVTEDSRSYGDTDVRFIQRA